MSLSLIRLPLALGALAALSACVASEPPVAPPTGPPAAGMCDPQRAASLSGGPQVSDEEARQRTGAAEVRQVGPDDAVTMDFQEARVTIVNEPPGGTIREARCG